MSLDKQTVTVPLTGEGLAEQDDAFAHDAPGFTVLQEARWNRDKQIGRRFGVTDCTGTAFAPRPFDASAAQGPNQIVDLDGYAHLLSSDGTGRFNPITQQWSVMSLAAPLPSRVVSDPIVRMSGTAMRSDCAVVGTIACVVWDTLSIGYTSSSTPTGWYQFFDVSEDTPRPLSPPQPFGVAPTGANICACRVIALQGRYFIIAGQTAVAGARALYAAAYDSAAGTYSFGVATGTFVDSISAGASMEFALDASQDQTTAYLAYHTGSTNRTIKRLDTTATVTATHALAAGGGLSQIASLQNSINKLFVVSSDGVVDIIDDALAGAATQVTPFTAPAAGSYTFLRAAIGVYATTGSYTNTILVLRSTAAPVRFGTDVTTQAAIISIAGALIQQFDIGGCSLATLCSSNSLTDGPSKRCFFGLTGQQAFFTEDKDPVNAVNSVAYRAAPVVQICQMFANTLAPQVVGRIGQDAFDMLGNADPYASGYGNTGASQRLGHISADFSSQQSGFFCTAYPTLLADQLGGIATFAPHRGIDLAQMRVAQVTPARNVAAQSIRLIGCGHGTSMIDGVLHAENTPPGCEWLDFAGYDSSFVETGFASNGTDTPRFQQHIDYFGKGTTWGTPGPGGDNPNRQWGFKLVWRYVDTHGNVHRGPPSSTLWSKIVDLIDKSSPAHPGLIAFYSPFPTALLNDLHVTLEVEVFGAPPDFPSDFRSLGIVKPNADTTSSDRVVVAVTKNTSAVVSYAVALERWDLTQPAPRSLYTSDNGGAELESDPSPALVSLCSTQSRLWGLNAEDRLDVWYTKPIELGFAPEWSDTLRVRVPQDGGPGVAIAAIDDKVVVFKQSRVYVIEGDGGDASGNSSSLRPPRLVSSDVGCISVESVVEGPFGVLFLSQRGFMVLDRGLSYQFVGDKVIDQLRETNDFQENMYVRSAVLIPSQAEVRIVLNSEPTGGLGDGFTLIWNYRFNRWCSSAATPLFNALVDGAEWSLLLGVGNGVIAETPNGWAAPQFAPRWKTSWIKLNGIAGFGRVRRAVFVFRYHSGGIQIQAAQDYNATTETTRSWSASECAALQGSDGRLELAVHPLVQKCEAIQFEISFVGQSLAGAWVDLVGVTLEVGVKKGAYKRLSAAARK